MIVGGRRLGVAALGSSAWRDATDAAARRPTTSPTQAHQGARLRLSIARAAGTLNGFPRPEGMSHRRAGQRVDREHHLARDLRVRARGTSRSAHLSDPTATRQAARSTRRPAIWHMTNIFDLSGGGGVIVFEAHAARPGRTQPHRSGTVTSRRTTRRTDLYVSGSTAAGSYVLTALRKGEQRPVPRHRARGEDRCPGGRGLGRLDPDPRRPEMRRREPLVSL